jgi:hypothetical protein
MAPPLCVIDTNVLQKANASITAEPIARRKFSRRLALLKDIATGGYGVLF